MLASQQAPSPIGFLALKLPPTPCAVLLVHEDFSGTKRTLYWHVAFTRLHGLSGGYCGIWWLPRSSVQRDGDHSRHTQRIPCRDTGSEDRLSNVKGTQNDRMHIWIIAWAVTSKNEWFTPNRPLKCTELINKRRRKRVRQILARVHKFATIK